MTVACRRQSAMERTDREIDHHTGVNLTVGGNFTRMRADDLAMPQTRIHRDDRFGNDETDHGPE